MGEGVRPNFCSFGMRHKIQGWLLRRDFCPLIKLGVPAVESLSLWLEIGFGYWDGGRFCLGVKKLRHGLNGCLSLCSVCHENWATPTQMRISELIFQGFGNGMLRPNRLQRQHYGTADQAIWSHNWAVKLIIRRVVVALQKILLFHVHPVRRN